MATDVIEAFSKESLIFGVAYRTLCPFNIRYTHKNNWLGQIGFVETSSGKFAKFISLEFGVRAGIVLLRNYLRRGRTSVVSVLMSFAPNSENDLNAYIEYVSRRFVKLNLDSTDIKFASPAFNELCSSICKYECGYTLTHECINQIINQFKIKK